MDRAQEALRRLGDPTRLRVLRSLLEGRRNVSQIVAGLRLSQPQVSYHLRMLRESGLATEERDGRRVWYQANWESSEQHVRELLALLAGWAAPGRRGAGREAEPAAERQGARRRRLPEAAAERATRPRRPPETPTEAHPGAEKPRKPGGDIDDFLL